MTRGITSLKAKYAGNLGPQRPAHIDEAAWNAFVAVVRDGKALRAISRQTGLPLFKLSQMILRVDRDLNPLTLPPETTHDIALNSSLEALHLSTRARNALHKIGCNTVQSILNKDFACAIRSFGVGTRQEVALALAQHGFTPPASLEWQALSVDAIVRDLTRLRQTIERRYRSSLSHLARLENSVRKLSNHST